MGGATSLYPGMAQIIMYVSRPVYAPEAKKLNAKLKGYEVWNAKCVVIPE